ncbi:hypothetical protein Tco_1212081 [Tanacetum coccineum]
MEEPVYYDFHPLMYDIDYDQDPYDWQQNPYHGDDEVEENEELFAELDDLLEHLPFLNNELKKCDQGRGKERTKTRVHLLMYFPLERSNKRIKLNLGEKAEKVDDRDRFTRDDEPKARQDGSGVSDKAMSVEIAKNNSPGLSFLTPIEKATSALDYKEGPFPIANDNAKATSVRDDVGLPDVAADDNAKATGVCIDIDEADAAADDNEKVPISDVYNMPVDNGDVLMKDAHNIINHTEPPIHGFQIML